MVQPKKPPVSLRLPDSTRTAVEQYATERGIPRNAAYVEIIERGLKAATGSGEPRSAPNADHPTRPGQKVLGRPPPAVPQRPAPKLRVDTYPDWMRPTPRGAKK